MKQKIYFLLLSIWLFEGCNFNADVEPITTELGVAVVDENNTRRTGANVYLYRSKLDFEARVKPIANGTTDADGLVFFKGLEPVEYYVYAFYNNAGNYFDNSQADFRVGEVLVEGAIAFVSCTAKLKRPIMPTKIIVDEIWVMDYPAPDTSSSDANLLESEELFFAIGRIPKGSNTFNFVHSPPGTFKYTEDMTFGAGFFTDSQRRIVITNPIAIDLASTDAIILRTFENGLQKDEGRATVTSFTTFQLGFLTYPDRIRMSEKPDKGIVLDVKVKWE